MTLFGSPDWQAQNAPTLTPLGTFAVNTGGTQTFDIGPLLLPYHQAVAVYWIASPASVGEPVQAAITSDFDAVPLLQTTLIADGSNAVCAIPAAFFIDNGTGVINLTASPPSGGASPILGTLVVIGLSAPPVVIPTPRRQYIGHGATTDQVTAGAGADATVLAAPRPGQYYRLKMFDITFNAAPAAGTSVSLKALGSGLAMMFFRASGVISDSRQVALDLEWSDGVVLHNGTGVGANAIILYEVWNV